MKMESAASRLARLELLLRQHLLLELRAGIARLQDFCRAGRYVASAPFAAGAPAEPALLVRARLDAVLLGESSLGGPQIGDPVVHCHAMALGALRLRASSDSAGRAEGRGAS
eukprot:966960_1